MQCYYFFGIDFGSGFANEIEISSGFAGSGKIFWLQYCERNETLAFR
jgi:hypothetical protein